MISRKSQVADVKLSKIDWLIDVALSPFELH